MSVRGTGLGPPPWLAGVLAEGESGREGENGKGATVPTGKIMLINEAVILSL